MKEFRTGVDIVEVSRIEKALEKHGQKFLDRIYTEREIAYCKTRKMTTQRLAARFAAKEAVFKAASTIERLQYNQIEVLNDPEGSPEIELHGTKILKSNSVRISLSHTELVAMASVVLIHED